MDNGLDKQPMYARSRTQTRVHLDIMTLSKRWITCIYSLNLNAYVDYQVPKQMQTHYILHGRVVVTGWLARPPRVWQVVDSQPCRFISKLSKFCKLPYTNSTIMD